MMSDAAARSSMSIFTVDRPKMGHRLAARSANARAAIGERIQRAMRTKANGESLKRQARNIKATETMEARNAAMKAVFRRVIFWEFIFSGMPARDGQRPPFRGYAFSLEGRQRLKRC